MLGGTSSGAILVWDVGAVVDAFLAASSRVVQGAPRPTSASWEPLGQHQGPESRPVSGRGSEGGRRRRRSATWRFGGTDDHPPSGVSCGPEQHAPVRDSALLPPSSPVAGSGRCPVVRPLLVLPRAHQSGVNCISTAPAPWGSQPAGQVKPAHGGTGLWEGSCEHLLVLSGGDDQALRLTLVRVEPEPCGAPAEQECPVEGPVAGAASQEGTNLGSLLKGPLATPPTVEIPCHVATSKDTSKELSGLSTSAPYASTPAALCVPRIRAGILQSWSIGEAHHSSIRCKGAPLMHEV